MSVEVSTLPRGSLAPRRLSQRTVRRAQWALLALVIAGGLTVPLSAGFAEIRLHHLVAVMMVLLPASLVGLLALGVYDFVYRWPSTRSILSPQIAVIGSGDVVAEIGVGFCRSAAGALVGVFRTDQGAGPYDAQAELSRLVASGVVDKVAIVLPADQQETAARIVRALSTLAVDIAIFDPADAPAMSAAVPGAQPEPAPRPRAVLSPPLAGWRMVAKDAEDRVLGLLLLIICLPLLVLIAVAVKLSSPGPVLFKQLRHGFRGQEVLVYKFRTMRTDAADYSGRNQTRRGDPRVTRIGRFLRASSLDELPQLLNVVRGEMSIVGPRPHPVDMRTDGLLCRQIVEDYHSRHRVRPGITGWAQINGYRGATTTREQVVGRVRLDNHYIDNWSLLFDLRIILLTAIRVVADKNAY